MSRLSCKGVDSGLGIIQKIAVISGIVIGACLFLRREEASTHVQMEIDSLITSSCVYRGTLSVENLSGQVLTIESAITRLVQPDFSRVPDYKDVSKNVVGTQVLQLGHVIRIGEVARFGFNIEPTEAPSRSYYVVLAAINVREEKQQWFRMMEGYVPAVDCKDGSS